jgi:hypothetical protein
VGGKQSYELVAKSVSQIGTSDQVRDAANNGVLMIMLLIFVGISLAEEVS